MVKAFKKQKNEKTVYKDIHIHLLVVKSKTALKRASVFSYRDRFPRSDTFYILNYLSEII